MNEPTGEPINSGRTFQSAEIYSDLNHSKERSFPARIERSDLVPHAIASGGTEIVLQRHGTYRRDPGDVRVGSLTGEAVAAEKEAALSYFSAFLANIPETERANVDVLFLASDTQFAGGGKRSLETAAVAQQAAIEVFEREGLRASNILNANPEHYLRGGDGPKPMPHLREPQMFDGSPDFVNFLKEKYGELNTDFWVAFEEDKERETRLDMGAEGPDEIADRMAQSVRVMARYAQAYHVAKPDRRLVIWADTHYDTISPYVKREIFGVGKEVTLQVENGAGVVIDIDPSGRAKTEIALKEYAVEVKKPTS